MASIIHLVVTASDRTGRALGSAGRSVGRFLRDSDRGFQRLGNRIGDNINRGLRAGERGLGRGLRGVMAGFGRSIANTLAGGIGEGLQRAARNPYVAAAIGVLAVTAASLLGAAIAGALVLAIGGAFIGLGVLLAFQSKKVKDAWKGTLSELKPLFEDAATPLLPVIEHARVKLEGLAKQFAPHFKSALEAAAPHVQTFFDRFVNGFKLMGEKAAGPLERAFNVFLDAFGPVFEDFMAGFGDSLAALANTVSDHSTEIATALGMVLSLLTTAIDVVNFFANAWVFAMRGAQAAIGHTAQFLGMFIDLALGAFDRILGAAQVFSDTFHLGLGGAIGSAREKMKGFRDTTVQRLMDMGQAGIDFGSKLDKANKRRKLDVDIQSLETKLAIARADLKRTTDPVRRAQIQANIDDLTRKAKRARAELAAIDGTVATTYILTYSKTYRSIHDIVGKATGGITGAATGGARNNMTLVGEQGPELVNLPAGSHVRSNSDSRRIGAGGGGGMEPFVILIDVGGDRLAEVLVDPLRRVVSRRGGVQATFGKLS